MPGARRTALFQCQGDVRLSARLTIDQSRNFGNAAVAQRTRRIDVGKERVDCGRTRLIRGRAIADLTLRVVAPAIDRTAREQSTGMFLPDKVRAWEEYEPGTLAGCDRRNRRDRKESPATRAKR